MSKSRPRSEAPASTTHGRGDGSLKRKALVLALFLILAASVLNALFGERGVLSLIETRHDYRTLLAEIETLEEENQHLAGEIRALRSEPMTIERIAREVLGMARPGEIVVEIRDDEDAEDR